MLMILFANKMPSIKYIFQKQIFSLFLSNLEELILHFRSYTHPLKNNFPIISLKYNYFRLIWTRKR